MSDVAYLIDRLAAFPDWLAARAAEIPPEHSKWKPEGAEFCWTGHICHLRDIERENYSIRIARILEEAERPLVEGFDGMRIAAERDYPRQDAARAFKSYRLYRGLSLEMLRAASSADFERRGTFGVAEGFSLVQSLGFMAHHDDDHRGQIEALIVAARSQGVF